MDGNYEITNLKVSPEIPDLMKETCNILQAIHMSIGITTGTSIELAARSQIDKSRISSIKKERLKELVSPANEELNRWYFISNSLTSPSLTPQGTMDVRASVRAMLAEPGLSCVERFQLASKVCLQDHLMLLSKALVLRDVHKLRAQSRLSYLWYRCHRKPSFTGLLKPRLDYNKGLVLALREYNEAAVQIFIDQVPPKRVSKTLKMALLDGPLKSLDTPFSPTMVCTLFRHLNAKHQLTYNGAFAALLLNALLKWPHQDRFLDAAKTLVPHLNQEQCFRVMTCIATRVVDRYTGIDYRALYTQFTMLISRYRGNLSMFFRPEGNQSLRNLIRIGGPVVYFVLSHLPLDLREALLMESGANDYCEALLFRQRFDRLEVLVRGCGIHSVDLLFRMRNAFVNKFDKNQELGKWKALRKNTYLRGKAMVKWRLLRGPFMDMMDRIIAEKRAPIYAMKNTFTRLSSQVTKG